MHELDTDILQAINKLDWAIFHLQNYTLKNNEAENKKEIFKLTERIQKIKKELIK